VCRDVTWVNCAQATDNAISDWYLHTRNTLHNNPTQGSIFGVDDMAESLLMPDEGAEAMSIHVPPSTAYSIHIIGTLAPLSVLRFKVIEAISTPYCAEIEVTSPIADLPMASILGKPASFTIQPIDSANASLRALVGWPIRSPPQPARASSTA
jgi:hypothetical protein